MEGEFLFSFACEIGKMRSALNETDTIKYVCAKACMHFNFVFVFVFFFIKLNSSSFHFDKFTTFFINGFCSFFFTILVHFLTNEMR